MSNEHDLDNKNEPGSESNSGDHTEIGEISGGTVAVGRNAVAIGSLTVGLGPEAVEELADQLVKKLRLDSQIVRTPGDRLPSKEVDQQIEEVIAAQRETAVQGVPISPQASYQLGILAAYRRDYEVAITYFQEAGNADPDYSDAFEAIAWLQQSLAMKHLEQQDNNGALDRLAKARSAAAHTDPLDARALALRGFIAKTMAQIADDQQDLAGRTKYYNEAARLFEHILKLDPNNPSAHNGLANIAYANSDYDTAVTFSLQAIALAPHYTNAHKDLALAYEAKWREEPDQGAQWCALALAAWREAYHLAPDDPGFTADRILKIGQQIRRLEQYCD